MEFSLTSSDMFYIASGAVVGWIRGTGGQKLVDTPAAHTCNRGTQVFWSIMQDLQSTNAVEAIADKSAKIQFCSRILCGNACMILAHDVRFLKVIARTR